MIRGTLAHLTTINSRSDIRIRVKEVETLAAAFPGRVTLFVQDGLGDAIESEGRVRIRDVGHPPQGRLRRMALGPLRMYRATREERPAVVHVHNPELLFAALALKLGGAKVIYDVHEHFPRQIRGKFYLHPLARRPVALAFGAVERVVSWFMDAIVPAWPGIEARFPARKTVTVRNFPPTGEFELLSTDDYLERDPAFGYIGGISEIRGIREMVRAIAGAQASPPARLVVAGSFERESLRREVESEPGWRRVEFLGWVARDDLNRVLRRVRAGLVLLHPVPNHLESEPNKLFEYMAAGLPVVASDFPHCRSIIEGARCGLLVNPLDPNEIRDAMQWILDHPEEARAMGERGRKAVRERYNWSSEGQRLVELYRELLGE